MPYRKTPWILFAVALLLAAYYILHTSPTLPPLLPGTQAIAAMLGVFLVTAGWIIALMAAFRRPQISATQPSD